MHTASRLGAAALTGLLLAGTAAAPALADTPTASPTPVAVPAGVYGKGDPTYDGVWRQSLALTALAGAKVVPADSAVGWLTGQQCADGGWPSFRADAGTPCDPKTEDSNATAAAVQALVQLGGQRAGVTKGVDWLKANQNADGSWPYNPGSPGDANSTGLAINALTAAGADPTQVSKNGRSAYDGLAAFQLGCTAPAAQRGAFAFQPAADGTLAANTLASAQAALGAAGGKLPVTNTNRVDAAPKPLSCGTDKLVPHAEAGEAAAAYLYAQLNANGQHLMQTTPGATPTPDFASTSWAVLGLIQSGHPHQAASAADWLAGNGYAWAAKGKNGTDAAAAAALLLVAEAAKLDPYNFGGTNILQLLVEAGPAPKSVPSAAASALAENPDGTKAPGSGITEADDNSGFSPIWLVGIGLLIGIGGGLLLSLNRRRGNASAAKATKATKPTGDSGDSGDSGDEQK
ncbi:prenyltransferase/squalene oxidase repeat-containing protein [Kitasatospora sp. McL0602]|uniref:prenyltransferase/squalene oxidase repeat-containing protein n=1 Tax=Kitasatospora sp. McL0602 TaxID=3439530 RepID=UPI003F8B3B7D